MLDIQKEADKWFRTMKFDYWTSDEILLQIDSECGELSSEILSRFGPKRKKSTDGNVEIGAELSDVLFAITCMANVDGVHLASTYNNQMRIGDIKPITTLHGIEAHCAKYGPREKNPIKLYRDLVQIKGKIAQTLEERDKYGTGNIALKLVDGLTNLVAQANLHKLDLKKAWDDKMEIRYGRDKDRFKNV